MFIKIKAWIATKPPHLLRARDANSHNASTVLNKKPRIKRGFNLLRANGLHHSTHTAHSTHATHTTTSAHAAFTFFCCKVSDHAFRGDHQAGN